MMNKLNVSSCSRIKIDTQSNGLEHIKYDKQKQE